MLKNLTTKNGRTQDGQIVLMITTPIVYRGPSGELGFAPGEVVQFDSEHDIPAGLTNASEAFRGELPHALTRFDPAHYQKIMAPRPEPAPDAQLGERDVLKEFGWNREQLSLALASGFPRPDGTRISKSAPLGSVGSSTWRESTVDRWAGGIRSLNVR